MHTRAGMSTSPCPDRRPFSMSVSDRRDRSFPPVLTRTWHGYPSADPLDANYRHCPARVKQSSSMHVRMCAQDGCSMRGLLYPTAVWNAQRRQEYRQGRVDTGPLHSRLVPDRAGPPSLTASTPAVDVGAVAIRTPRKPVSAVLRCAARRTLVRPAPTTAGYRIADRTHARRSGTAR
jgi:hypothetical protein